MEASSELGESVVQRVQFGQQLALGDPPVAVQRMLPGADEEAGQFQQRAVAACDVGDLQAEVVAVEDSPLQKRRRSRGGTVDQAWTAHRFSNRVSSHFAVASARPAFQRPSAKRVMWTVMSGQFRFVAMAPERIRSMNQR